VVLTDFIVSSFNAIRSASHRASNKAFFLSSIRVHSCLLRRSCAKASQFVVNNRLTARRRCRTLRGFFENMARVCSITGSRAARGSVIHRRGMAKKKGGVGRHVTKNVPRIFAPNLHEHRIWVPELKRFVRVRVTARGLKTINKNGAYRALKKAGAI
jgi:large subunit ribosomal protein L28